MKYESEPKHLAQAIRYIRKCQKDKYFDMDGSKWMLLSMEVRNAIAEIYLKQWTRLAKSDKVK